MTKEEAIEYLYKLYMKAEITDVYGDMDDTEPYETAIDMAIEALSEKPISCKDCKWWEQYEDYDFGNCNAAKHCYCSSHWDIRIRRTYPSDFFCADAETREEKEEDE